MLNELYQLSVVLENIGINPYDWHKDLKPLPNTSNKKPCYRISIGPNGSIALIELMKKELVSSLRKWQNGSNGYSFPAFNILPFYCVAGEEENKLLGKWRKGKEKIDKKQLKEWCIDKNETKYNEQMLNECLGRIPQELKRRCAQLSDDFLALVNLLERVESSWGNNGCSKFINELKNYIWKKIENDENVSYLLPILISLKAHNISVFLDVLDWKKYPVAHEKTIKFINDCLLNSEGLNNTKTGDEDAFGYGASGFEGMLPEVKLPVIGGVKLRAMNSESRCQYRYGTIDANSFLIGTDSRKHTKGALEWLSSDEHEGKTWGRADGKELIFAYPSILPKAPLKLASCLGARKADDTEARFEDYAKDVVNCLNGIGRSLKEIELRVFSLRKMDKARTKVVFHRHYSAQRLADAASEWQQGCANIPIIRIKSWSDKKGKTILIKPKTPFPLQIADCLNRVWKRDGTSKCEVKTISKYAGIELLIDESTVPRQVPNLLTVALQNCKELLLSLGDNLHRDEIMNLDGLNKYKQLIPTILGLLLWKLSIGKETYMNHPPYLVGRMLKLADELHALYCREVRKNNLPPQLLGNALMVAALDTPTQALAQLALRIVPYLGWARTNSTESAGLSIYFLKEFELVEAKLRNLTLPLRLNDPARAQLFLGYISGSSQTNQPTNI